MARATNPLKTDHKLKHASQIKAKLRPTPHPECCPALRSDVRIGHRRQLRRAPWEMKPPVSDDAWMDTIISCLPCISSLPSPPSTRGTNGYYYTFCTRRCEASQELYDGDGPVPTVPTTGLSPRVSFERSCGVILAASCKYLRSLWARAGGSHVDGGGRSRLLARAGGGRGCSCVVPVAAVSDACALYPWLPCPMSREIGTRASSAQ